MTSKSISQNLNDSVTCIPNTQLRLAINLIEKGKITNSKPNITQICSGESPIWNNFKKEINLIRL